jgi:hypothetical protein
MSRIESKGVSFSNLPRTAVRRSPVDRLQELDEGGQLQDQAEMTETAS